jgi:DNA gyrase inhibitor GyrI
LPDLNLPLKIFSKHGIGFTEVVSTSGYQPDDKPCFEMYPEEPKDGKFIVDICVPV